MCTRRKVKDVPKAISISNVKSWKETNVERIPNQDEREKRTIMPGCLGIRGLLHNIVRINLLNDLNPNPFILLLRLGCVARPNPPPPFTNQGHLRRVELESSLHHLPPAEDRYGEGGSLSSSSLDERLPVEE